MLALNHVGLNIAATNAFSTLQSNAATVLCNKIRVNLRFAQRSFILPQHQDPQKACLYTGTSEPVQSKQTTLRLMHTKKFTRQRKKLNRVQQLKTKRNKPQKIP